MAICPKCGNQTAEGAVFCDQCGTRLAQAEPAVAAAVPAPTSGSVICPACGAGNVPGEAFCDFCGGPLAAPAPDAPAAPAPEAPAPATPTLQGTSVPAAVEEQPTCAACGAKAVPGEAFCPDCGASLAQAPIPPEPVPEATVAPAPVEEPPAPVPAVEAQPAADAVPAPAPTPAPAPVCPACGVEVEAGDKFCGNCGAVLGAAPSPAQAVEPVGALPPAPVVPATPAGPRLVVVDSGAVFGSLDKPEILIGRTDPDSGAFPEVDLTDHGGIDGGVSRRHARLIREGGDYFLEDLNSTNGTFVNKQRLAPKTRQPLKDGDEIRCGRVTLLFRTGG